MANRAHVEVVKGGRAAILAWREANPHAQLDLTEADLEGIDLGGADLRGSDLGGTNLAGACLVGANLGAAYLDAAHLREADLRDAELGGANLRRAFLRRAVLRRARLHGADLIEANLSRADLRESHLSGADLAGAHLRRAHLGKAYLYRANLSGADLIEANLDLVDLGEAHLREANLCGASLSGANLHEANLRGARLIAADLSQSDLRRADLRGADLGGANLGGASAGFTVFADLDLSSVAGLDTVVHHGPSTLNRSGWKIPRAFLRGCGLSDCEIAFARLSRPDLTDDRITTIGYEIITARLDQPVQTFSAYIAFSPADRAFAQILHDALQEHGVRCWLDEHKTLSGDETCQFKDVAHGRPRFDKLLLCCSQNSLARNRWLEAELEKSLAKERQLATERGRRIQLLIPLDLDGYVFQWRHGQGDLVRTRVAADFIGCPANAAKFRLQVDRLIAALHADGGRRGALPPPRLNHRHDH